MSTCCSTSEPEVPGPVETGSQQSQDAKDDAENDEPRQKASSKTSERSSDSSGEAGIASPPPNKRSRRRPYTGFYDPRIDALISQVSYLTQYISTNTLPDTQSISHETNYLQNPANTKIPNLSLGDLNTDFDDNKIIPLADKERLASLNRLQQFETAAWKGIRYKKALQSFGATPGFVALKVNEELCHLNTTKDYLASTEQVLAGLSNAILEQRQMLQIGLQTIVNWAAENKQDLNPSNLYDMISKTFGPGTPIYKNSEQTMQVVCGKRSECIEIRRDHLLKQIANLNLKATLRNVPPSA